MEIPQESITLKSITLTKADAATRQIDAAIEALLHDRFDIAITLAGAAEDMIAAALFQSWVMGYISAVNGNAPGPPNITQGTDAAGLWAWLDNYCEKHPLDKLGKAMDFLILELTDDLPAQ